MFFKTKKGNLIEGIIALTLMGILSFGFWAAWNSTMTSAGDAMKTKIETDSWLD